MLAENESFERSFTLETAIPHPSMWNRPTVLAKLGGEAYFAYKR